jgi:hypothetical protein
MLAGCDSGEKVVDKVTGNEAVKEYHKLKKDIGKIEDQQAKRYNDILDEDKKDGNEKRWWMWGVNATNPLYAVTQLLIEKGIITKREFYTKLKQVRHKYEGRKGLKG